MLKKVNTSELKENMRFSAPVFFDDGIYMLVDEGVPLHQRELNALERWDISFVLTAGRELAEGEALDAAKEGGELAVESPAPSDFSEFDTPENEADSSDAQASVAQKQKTLAEVFPDGRMDRLPPSIRNAPQYALYESIIASLDEFFESIKNSASVKSRAVDGIVSDLHRFILDDRAHAIRCILGNDISDKEMAKDAVHAAIISMISAESLSISEAEIEQILAGALLHDVGMLRVPDKIVSKAGKLSDDELAIIRSHPSYGYKIIVDDLMYPDEVALAAAQHHEQWDGNGYPAGLAGEKISLQARIVSAADAFVAMVSPRSYRSNLSGYEAMKSLVADNARRFDPDIVKAMMQNIGIYPVGSIVLMNNAAIARVIQVFPGMPLRPVIKIIIDEAGQSYSDDESETVDLRTNKSLFIVRDLNPSEI